MYDPRQMFAIIHPHAAARSAKVDRFAYYTRAETAVSVIQNESIWLRKTSCMNDYRELTFGWECLSDQLISKAAQLRQALDPIFPGLASEVTKRFQDHARAMMDQTYIACVSEHTARDDKLGRLSMWRAYGGTTGVAIIFKKEAAQVPGLPYYASPVLYTNAGAFGPEFDRVVSGLLSARTSLRAWGRKQTQDAIVFSLTSALASIKHIGFEEEREWRIIYSPSAAFEKLMPGSVRTINGVPQIIHEISLARANRPDSLINYIDQIIVGPTQYPKEIAEAIKHTLNKKGFAGIEVVISDIPLRHNS